MAEAGDSHSVAVLDGNLYAVGGYNGDYFSSVERYDPALDAWEALAPMGPAPQGQSKKQLLFGQGRLQVWIERKEKWASTLYRPIPTSCLFYGLRLFCAFEAISRDCVLVLP